ncbi:Hypothetical_protein [Hexamita inflata]|uniref:Hypothetical_protein n=1 Tax=Hexamita inflata TaxID=28002 RepID=A0AA86N7R5_9EUKA|nr:Hypothetical protein HINF_LOCUS1609 [Hexamita inflata]
MRSKCSLRLKNHLCIKLFYSLLISTVIITGLVFSFDVFVQTLNFKPKKFNLADQFSAQSGSQEAYIRTSLGLIIDQIYFNAENNCISTMENINEPFVNYKGKFSSQIEVEVTNGKSKLRDVKCASMRFVNDQTNSVEFQISAWCSFGGMGLLAVIMLFIWTCCTGWCRCCKEKMISQERIEEKRGLIFNE